MDSIQQLIQQARQQDCSDIHLTPGHPPYFRKVGNLICSQQPAEASETEEKILALLNDQQKQADHDDVVHHEIRDAPVLARGCALCIHALIPLTQTVLPTA